MSTRAFFSGRFNVWLGVLGLIAVAAFVMSSLVLHTGHTIQVEFVPAAVTGTRPPIYATDPDDAWNRIFRCLFTRAVKARLSSEFPEGAPFASTDYGHFSRELSVSTRAFDRVENGDRAIEPIYPSFLSYAGACRVLSEPLYSQLRQALADALEEETQRPPLDRALMQSDVWAAYDRLYRLASFSGEGGEELHGRREQLLRLLARFIRKLALTRGEIETLPDNYAEASSTLDLPKLFDPRSGWMEIQWRPDRVHDASADDRRVARVFIRPASTPKDKQEFLNSLRDERDVSSKLDAVALVIQNLLIDSCGEIVPSSLTYDVQIRRRVKDDRGAFTKTEVEEYELSRQLLRGEPASGGLVGANDRTPAYLPAAGNDYEFASTQVTLRRDTTPILATLRSRCVACHAQDVSVVFTFTTTFRPPFPPVAELDPSHNDHAFFVVHRKTGREDFRALSEQEMKR